jgi:hypothetical protein
MTRDEFTTGYVQRMRNVIQKHDRVKDADDDLTQHGYTPWRQRAYDHAQDALQVALVELADFAFDVLEKADAA